MDQQVTFTGFPRVSYDADARRHGPALEFLCRRVEAD